jgi:hypothetical protein
MRSGGRLAPLVLTFCLTPGRCRIQLVGSRGSRNLVTNTGGRFGKDIMPLVPLRASAAAGLDVPRPVCETERGTARNSGWRFACRGIGSEPNEQKQEMIRLKNTLGPTDNLPGAEAAQHMHTPAFFAPNS